jgi:cytochrome c-type biogenesis protein CcmH
VSGGLAGRLLALLSILGTPLAAQQPELTPIDPAQVESVVGAPQGRRLTGEALEAEALRISSVLRCPVCQGLSVADSPSPMATHMRQQVRDLVAAGFVEEQVLAYFEASYGEFVRLEPPLRGVNWLVWLAPAGGLALGLGIVVWLLRGARATSAAASRLPQESEPSAAGPQSAESAPAEPDGDRLPDDPALARAVLRVRETAYGWPGGRRPEAS